jgi:SRSO17 transposase
MPRTVPNISASAGEGKKAAAHATNPEIITRQIKNFLRFIFALTRVERQTTL